MEDKIKSIVAFCVLMESHGGIMDKSPDYVLEKFQRYCMNSNPEEYNWGLDSDNTRKLQEWIDLWMKEK
jgi:hypothetical protein